MPKSNWKIWTNAVILFIFSWVGPVQAAFVLVDDFEGLSPGSIDGQNNWQAPGDSGTVVVDPVALDNQLLKVITESNYLHKPAAIPNETARMLFLRFRIGNQLNFSFGISDATMPDQFDDFESELGLRNATQELRVNNGGSYDVLVTLLADTWYNLWMRIDNDTDTTTVWLNDVPGADAVETDILENDEGTTVFQFRNGGTVRDLLTFFIKTGGGNSQNSGPLYIDDIYLEDSDVLNLKNPTFCECDLNFDGSCNGLDWLIFYPDWGRTDCKDPGVETCECDLNDDGRCDGPDWLLFYPDWGRTDCPVPEI
jgi:hypothetical protein